MSLKDKINEQNIIAIKNKDEDAKGILSILKNKILVATIEKRTTKTELTDADVISIIQKTVKELDEEKESFAKANRVEKVKSLENQKALISQYLPQLMSEDEIREKISNLEDKSIGNVMRYFKSNFAGKVDMSKVSKILKEFN